MSVILQELITAIRSASVFNAEVEVAPACILWPDRERQWEAIIPRLQEQMPELCVLGSYDAAKRRGPAIWLRAAIAGHCLEKAESSFVKVVEEAQAAYNQGTTAPQPPVPIIYLPGVGRQDLRAVESCPDELKPLAELQYRGTIWSQINARDWSILAFLKSDQGGLGLDVAQDNDAKRSMQLALYRFVDEEVELLRGKRLDRDYFNKLLTSGDPIRDLLMWIDQGDVFKAAMGETEWQAFVEVIRSQIGFNLEQEGQLSAAEKLATHEGAWSPVWQRYVEAPARYPSIPQLIERCPLPSDLFADPSGWPQLNARNEAELESSLKRAGTLAPHDARKLIRELDQEHGERRSWVWAELGQSPLAVAVGHLAEAARICEQTLAVGSVDDMVAVYNTNGWMADWSVLKALQTVAPGSQLKAVQDALACFYKPWLEEAAQRLQQLVGESGYPRPKLEATPPSKPEGGTLVLFVDGLRFDLGKKLAERLEQANIASETEHVWSALPSVTATAKPAVSPVRHEISGADISSDFEPSVKETGKSLKGGYHLKKLLKDAGWQILDSSDSGDPSGLGWAEIGEIDSEGHADASKLAKNVEALLQRIVERIQGYLQYGWKRIDVVTDHGFLLLPGGLPTTKLSTSLSENTWGRCAALKTGAHNEEAHFSWFWNTAHSFALPEGISCYGRSRDYAHGGLSLQECLTQKITIDSNRSGNAASVEITDRVWRGMRLTVALAASEKGWHLDVRKHAGDPATSVTMSPKPFKGGKSSVVVEDDELLESKAYAVIVGDDGQLLAQIETSIGDM